MSRTCSSTKDAKWEEAPTVMFTRRREKMGELMTSKASSQGTLLQPASLSQIHFNYFSHFFPLQGWTRVLLWQRRHVVVGDLGREIREQCEGLMKLSDGCKNTDLWFTVVTVVCLSCVVFVHIFPMHLFLCGAVAQQQAS